MKYLVILLSLLCLFLWVSWQIDKREWTKEQKFYSLKDSLLQTKIKDIKDSSGKEITLYKVQSITKEQLAQSASQEATQLRYDLKLANLKGKDLKSSTTVYNTTHDTVKVFVQDSIPLVAGDYRLPFSDTLSDSFMKFKGIAGLSVFSDGLTLKTITLDYQLKGGVAVNWVDKSRFLQKPQLELMVTELNPHTTTNKVQTYSIQSEKRLYQKWWFHAGIGALSVLVLQHYIK